MPKTLMDELLTQERGVKITQILFYPFLLGQFSLGVNHLFSPLVVGSVPKLGSSLRSQCCEMILFDLFSTIVD